MKRLVVSILVALLTLFVFNAIAENTNNLPTEWKYDGKKMPILLEYEYSTPQGQSFLRGFICKTSDYPERLSESQRKMRERGLSLSQLPIEAAEMYNELATLTNEGVIGIRFFMFTKIVAGIKIKPEQLLIAFADGRSCQAVGLVYFDVDKTDTRLGTPLLIKRSTPEKKPLEIVAYIPQSFRKPHKNYPDEKWVIKITILPTEPQTAKR